MKTIKSYQEFILEKEMKNIHYDKTLHNQIDIHDPEKIVRYGQENEEENESEESENKEDTRRNDLKDK